MFTTDESKPATVAPVNSEQSRTPSAENMKNQQQGSDLKQNGVDNKQSTQSKPTAQKIPVSIQGMPPTELEPKWKSYAIRITAIVLLLLVLSYFLVISGAYEQIMGLFTTKTENKGIITAGNVTLEIQPEVLKKLQDAFLQHQDREIKACLTGTYDSTKKYYTISEIKFPGIVSADVVHITTDECPSDTLVDLHSHPVNYCTASDTDIKTYTMSKNSNPNLLMVVMCNTNRFSVYS
jgi:hypothetical protein